MAEDEVSWLGERRFDGVVLENCCCAKGGDDEGGLFAVKAGKVEVDAFYEGNAKKSTDETPCPVDEDMVCGFD